MLFLVALQLPKYVLTGKCRPGIPNWVSLLFISPVMAGQGFAFPATVIGILASNTQADQAVVSTTLSLWRQLGTVMGVAVSSLVFQNVLVTKLDELVTEPNKRSIVFAVRKSVASIRTLDTMHKLQGLFVAEARALMLTEASDRCVYGRPSYDICFGCGDIVIDGSTHPTGEDNSSTEEKDEQRCKQT